MQAHQLLQSKRGRQRIGRGGKRGSFSGRGIKGQKARAGRRVRPQIRDILKKIHKRRGYGRNRAKSVNTQSRKPRIVKKKDLNRLFNNGDRVTIAKIVAAGLVKRGESVKILGGEATNKKLTFDKNILFSSALQKTLDVSNDK